ncbi:MAG: SUF system NifU family Fe-S cluster assembly protein [Myxococcales bacterium]|nr:MAG: SUF system NifU family Fe-S cluster assembly protein [Myxococcales bacterium]
MSELRELYQELILDHGKQPRNFRFPEPSTHSANGHNPLCGDNLILKLRIKDNRIEDVGFQGSGCAISTASASTMTEAIKGKSLEEVEALFSEFHNLVTLEHKPNEALLGKLAAFSGVVEFPMRVKCATLAWHTLHAALENKTQVSTE